MAAENNPGYIVLTEGGEGEIVEKKSRFIATVRPVETEAEAEAFIDEMKKKYWDARHNCSAFVIGDRGQTSRCSDDGEPSGTAGRPMLEVLLNEGVRNIAVVVTRYFGGVLLGTGGLVRAYQGAVKEGLKNCKLGEMYEGITYSVTTDYTGLGKIQYILGEEGITPDTEYTENVKITFTVPKLHSDRVCKAITEGTAGKAIITEENCGFFLKQIDNISMV